LSHYVAPDPVDFTTRLSSCRFQDVSTIATREALLPILAVAARLPRTAWSTTDPEFAGATPQKNTV
jgi:hypothetical protein